MSEQVPVETKLTKHDAIKAIEALQKSGADLNPYSLAEELQIPHSVIVTNADIMEVLSLARGEVNGVVAAEYERLLRRVEELERINSSLTRQSEEAGGSGQVERLQTENELLKDSKTSLSEQVQELGASKRQLEERLAELEKGLLEAKRIDEDGDEPPYDGEERRRKNKKYKKAINSARSEFESRERELKNTIERLHNEAQLSRESLKNVEEELRSTIDRFEREISQSLKRHQEELEHARAVNTADSANCDEHTEFKAKIEELECREAELAQTIQESEEREAQLTRILASMEAREQALVSEADELRLANRKLKEEIKALSTAQQVLALSVQESWQQGFDAAKREFEVQFAVQSVGTTYGEPPLEAAFSEPASDATSYATSYAADSSYEQSPDYSASGYSDAAQQIGTYDESYDAHQNTSESAAGPDPRAVQEMADFLMGGNTEGAVQRSSDHDQALSDQGFNPDYATVDPMSAAGLSLEEHPLNSGLLAETVDQQYEQYNQAAQPYVDEQQYSEAEQQYAAEQQYSESDQPYTAEQQYSEAAEQQYSQADQQYAADQTYAQADQQYVQAEQQYAQPTSQYSEADLYAQAENYDPYAKVDYTQSAQTPAPDQYTAGYEAQGVDAQSGYAQGYAAGAPQGFVPGAFGDASAPPKAAAFGETETLEEAPAPISDYSLPDYMNDGLFSEAPSEQEVAAQAEATAAELSDSDESSQEDKAPAFDPDELRGLLNKKVQHNKTQEINLGGGADAEGGPKSPLHKFVGGKHATQQGQEQATPGQHPRTVPPDIRKACMLLGIKPEDLSRPHVFDAWKREMSKPGVHPDTGGDTEMAMYLNNAKDTLVRYLDAQAPKLGKVFGASNKDGKDQQKGDNR